MLIAVQARKGLLDVQDSLIILLIVFLAGMISQNDLVAIAAAIMLALQAVGTPPTFAFLDRFAVEIGVIFLLIGVLLPFATGKTGLQSITNSLTTAGGYIAIVVGILSTWLGTEGIRLLAHRPEVMIGLVIGSIIGVSWFDGIPTGPLVAAGIAALLFRLFNA